MTLALGDCGYREALPLLEELTDWEFDATILYDALGDAIVRLSARDCHDAEPVLRLLERGNESLASGALHALATMRITPSDDAVATIIAYASQQPLDSQDRSRSCHARAAVSLKISSKPTPEKRAMCSAIRSSGDGHSAEAAA